MKVFAHRGYSGRYPENTMLAFKKVLETGCDGIELDVHETKDGRLVIIHDEYVDRTTDGTGRICDYSFDDLRKLNAAKLFPKLTDFEPIPSFDEYCQWVSGTGLITNVEIKTDNIYYHNIEKLIWEMIKSYALEDRIIFSSFNHTSVRKIKELAPKVPAGALVERENFVRGFPGYYCKSSGFDCYHPHVSMLNDENVKDCKDNGIKINAWVVNDMDGMEKLYGWDCDGLITNYPGVAVDWLAGKQIRKQV